MADERAAAGLVIPKGYSAAVAAGEQARAHDRLDARAPAGPRPPPARCASLAGEQVTVELASRAAAEAIWATRSYPAGAQDGGVAQAPPRRPGPSSPRPWLTRP